MLDRRPLAAATLVAIAGVVWLMASPLPAEASATPITGSATIRVAGADRYSTAAALSRKVFAAPQDVYIASGENFPDALAAGPLAGRGLPNPILLVRRTTLPEVTKAELKRLAPANVTIIGGLGAIDASVAAAVSAAVPAASVVRTGGANRFDTAAIIAEQMDMVQPWERMVLVSGENFPDAFAAGPLAIGLRGPMLLTKRDGLPTETQRVLEAVRPWNIWVVGGSGVVSTSVVSELHRLLPTTEVDRVWGRDRYATAANLAHGQFGVQRPQSVFMASGTNFPDALSAVPVAGNQPGGEFGGAPIVFTRPTCLPPATADYLALDRPILRVVVGGTAVAYNGDRRC